MERNFFVDLLYWAKPNKKVKLVRSKTSLNELKFQLLVDYIQAGAELCQAQVKLEVIADVLKEAWS